MNSSRPWIYFAFLVPMMGPLAMPAKAVTVEKQQGPYKITADHYSATVEPDGCLTNVFIDDQAFFSPGVSISRGSYFYHNGPLLLPHVTQPRDGVIRAEGDAALVEYHFMADRMNWKLTNKGDEQIVFFLVLNSQIAAMRDGSGTMHQAVFQGAGSESSWFRGNAFLTIQGSDKFWGPWHECQVVEIAVPARGSRQLTLIAGTTSDEDFKDIAGLVAPVAEPDLLIRSPLNYQVFQRDSEERGLSRISGRVTGDVDRVEVMISGESRYGDLPEEWQPIPWRPTGNQFQVSLRLPAGGWYQLKVRARKGESVKHEAVVPNFGIGEVFVGAGQSNSTNSGQFPTKQTSGMVSSFGGQRWKLADDPQLGVADRSQGGSFWPAFGDRLYKELGVPIGVATTGFGGTSVNQWQPAGDLFKWMMNRIGQLGPLGFRAVLWHQGESDVHMESNEYYRKLANVIQQSKISAGWEFPWYVAQVSYHNPDNTRFDTTRDAQSRLWSEGVALQGPDTDVLTGDHRDMDGRGIHFSPKGLKRHGEMWAEIVLPYIEESTQELATSTSK